MKATGHAGLDEPFAGLFTQGMVVHETYRTRQGQWVSPAEIRIGTSGGERLAVLAVTGEPLVIGSIEKMSKSKRNTVDPDDIIETFGADTARWFMLSDSPPERDVIWSEEGVQGASRYVQQLWRLIGEIAGIAAPVGFSAPADMSDKAVAIRRLTHGHLLRVQENIERLRFNTAIAEIRKLSNALSDAIGEVEEGGVDVGLAFAFREGGDVLVNLFAPMMPHLAEECWQALGHSSAIAEAAWPVADAALATTGPQYFDDHDAEHFMALAAKTAHKRLIFGGDCYNYGLLASGHVDLVVEAGLKAWVEGDQIHMEARIRDDGPGVDVDRVDSIFEPFVHGSGPDGAGLGLSLVSAVAVSHGGRLELAEGPGEYNGSGPGLRVALVLPRVE
jgi:hypothetical protein